MQWLTTRLAHSDIDTIDRMDGITFEQRLKVLFTDLGYRVQLTRTVGDYGADLILSKDGIRTAVQAKHWNYAVGVKAVQEVVAAKAFYRCTAAIVVTTNYFTQQAGPPQEGVTSDAAGIAGRDR
jgi:restriction system protein